MDLDPLSLFRDLDAGAVLAVAVSGGSDSLALLLLGHDFVRRHRPALRLTAVTVDHGLRPESAAEAAWVAAFCRQRGIAHETVVWQGDKPETGLAAAAREARYRLLADAAQRAGASTILAGHTLDDQAETLAMRAARAEGAGQVGAGLAGMARATLFDGRVWIARPLLRTRRQALRDWLGRRGVEWIDDPSNDNPAYERVRVRKALAHAEVETLGAEARRQALARQALAERAAAWIGRFASRPAPGLLRLDPAFADDDDDAREAAILALRALLATAGGTPRLPDRARVETLLRRLADGAPMRATLSRAAVDTRRAGVFLRREARNLPFVPLGAGPVLWDGRLRATAAPGAHDLHIGPLGHDGAARFPAETQAGVPPALVRAAWAAEPALYSGRTLIGPLLAPAAAGDSVPASPTAAPFARFLTGFDRPLAAALQRLAGAPALPSPPWPEHIGPG
ncbi:MAG: tRNA lysidine(34) synthetase TilS [Aquamicrobium sp.]|uniref:tRNA lysidine(34) synthetase TilS n=1 Tax=Aquamicrobium sp. TaxID=1872579 RepID=UPI00349ED0AF|nr:tRNA lysidine(34) synthetase TilS [Aquamicrobium sp.]